MDITVCTERENRTETVLFPGKTVLELLQQLRANPETVIVVRNDEVLTPDEPLQDHDCLELLSVISGG